MKKESLIKWLSNEIDDRMSLEEHDRMELSEILNDALQKELINNSYYQGVIDGLTKEIKIKVEIDEYVPQRLRFL